MNKDGTLPKRKLNSYEKKLAKAIQENLEDLSKYLLNQLKQDILLKCGKNLFDDMGVLDLLFKEYGKKNKFVHSHIKYILKNDGNLWHLGINWDFLGFLEDYYHYSFLIPFEYTVVDVGCSTGLQQVFFKDHAGYIGIDTDSPMKSFYPNVTFITGLFPDCVNFSGDKYFGIANMSILYNADDVHKEFDKMFERKFIR